MIQDLQVVNDAVIQRAPCVAPPHTLLNGLRQRAKCLTVVDISNVFFSIPLDKDSQFWFAFTSEGKRYTYTRLPQGYCESPTIYSQVLMASMVKFDPPAGSQVLTYVDDVLLASPNEEACNIDTVALLKHLAKEGHKISKNKLQTCKAEVKYLEHNLSAGGRTIVEIRKAAVLQAPKPVTKANDVLFGTDKLLLSMDTQLCRDHAPAVSTNVRKRNKLDNSAAMDT